MKAESGQIGRDWIHLAWAGWRMKIPPDWRALTIGGEDEKGKMLVGDSAAAWLQVKWWRSGKGSFDFGKWLSKRIKGTKGYKRSDAGGNAARDRGFRTVMLEPENPREQDMRLWYGYAAKPGMVLEVALKEHITDRKSRQTSLGILKSVEASKPDEPTRWVVFDAGFETPPRFSSERRKMDLGDLSIEFFKPGGSRVVLRQVYPSPLALERRRLEKWLEIRPFKENRRFREETPAKSWEMTSRGSVLKGLIQRGTKRLPFPLGRISPRSSIAAVVEDSNLERLLYAESDSSSDDGEEILKTLIGRMNWNRTGAGEGE